MSGPYDVPDDPEDVTLWAGRLRAWPTPPAAPAGDVDVDDDTAVSARPARDQDTLRVERLAPPEDTVRVERPAPADDTVRVERPAPLDDTVRVERPAPVDDTVVVARDHPTPDPSPTPPVDETTAPGRRRGIRSSDVPADPEDEVPTGDTAAGTRRARSRARVETPEIPSGDPVPTPREARVPRGDHELYRPRVDEAIRVARSAPPARPAEAPDAADVRPRTPRRARTRGLMLAVAVVVLLAGAGIALFLLMG